MASWREIEQAAPELAALARQFLDARVHKTMALHSASIDPPEWRGDAS